MDEPVDVVVIGGGAAGLSGAVALARSRRSVIVVDAGDPRNAGAGHVHNFLTRDGTPPVELYALGRTEVEMYGGTVILDSVRALSGQRDQFQIELSDRVVTARRLLIATGSQDQLPRIPGLAERWGIDVLHCPYCHGWEVRDKRIGVLATSPASVHQALLFRQLSGRITLLQQPSGDLAADQAAQLAALGVAVVRGEAVEVRAENDRLTGVLLADGRHVELDALVVSPVCRARTELLAPLGITASEVKMGTTLVGTQVDTDPTFASSVPGVWVAGNAADVRAQVISSAAAGLAAGAAINLDLIQADAAAAVDRIRSGSASPVG